MAPLAPLLFHILWEDLDRRKHICSAFFRRAHHVAELQSCLSLCFGRIRVVAGRLQEIESQ
jgi:hypothetical protein